MDSNQFLDNLSTHLKNTIARALSIATTLQTAQVTPLHLLLSLSDEKGSVGAELLRRASITHKDISKYTIKQKPEAGAASSQSVIPSLSEASKKVLERAMLAAYQYRHPYVGTEHLLYGLIVSRDAGVVGLWKQKNIAKAALKEHIEAVFHGTNKFPEMEEVAEMMESLGGGVDEPFEEDAHGHGHAAPATPLFPQLGAKKQKSALAQFTTDLTAKHMQDAIDPVVGREKEITRLIHILSRRTKNNPVLVGEPGVGKTAIVEGLAKRIAEGSVPDILKRKKILSLDMTALISGTIYRGEFESRLKHLLDELTRQTDIILFIDELHNIIGSGSNQGTMDTANMLKPALARGQLRCIGATTSDEYTKYISTDPALERRFQPIDVEEPSENEALTMLFGIRSFYERFHHVRFTDDALRAAVRLSRMFIQDKCLPDKAIDLLDEAGAAVRAKSRMSKTMREQYALLDKKRMLEEQKETAIGEEAFERAMKTKQELEALEKKIAALSTAEKNKKKLPRKTVTDRDIAQIIAQRLGVDADRVMHNRADHVRALGEQLRAHIIGQDHIVELVVRELLHADALPRRKEKPKAVFLFTGPSGVGKTALGKALAQELFLDERALIKLDMSEFAEPHTISKLLGAPAGYVGHNERNRFLEQVRKRPHAVILLDEFDKAHHDVQKLLLHILDEGMLTDNHGKKISFRESIIILTTNIGAEYFRSAGIGFDRAAHDADTPEARAAHDAIAPNVAAAIKSKLKEEFGAALFTRINTVGIFRPLSQADMERIVEQKLKHLNAGLQEAHQFSVEPDAQLVRVLATDAKSDDHGARGVERIVETALAHALAGSTEKRMPQTTYRLTKQKDVFVLV